MKEAKLYYSVQLVNFIVCLLTYILLGWKFSSGIFFSFVFSQFSVSFLSVLSLVRIWLLDRKRLSPCIFANIKGIVCIGNVYRCTPDLFISSSAQHDCFLEYLSQYLGCLAIDSIFPYFIIFYVILDSYFVVLW